VGSGSFSAVVEARTVIDGKPAGDVFAIKKILCLTKYKVMDDE